MIPLQPASAGASRSRRASRLLLPIFCLALSSCTWFKKSPSTDPSSLQSPAEFEPMDTGPRRLDPLAPPQDAPAQGARATGTRPAGDAMAVIYFDYDDSRLRPDQIDRIDRNFRYLRDNPSVKVLIEGHCDERGTTEYNYVLGENRAKGVRDYFIRNGISPARVQILSRGEEDPIDPGHDETAWSKNRRCEFKFFDQ